MRSGEGLQVRIYVGRHAHHLTWCNAFARGLMRHGITATMTTPENVKQCDVAVFWSHRFDSAQAQCENYVVLENPPVRMDGYASAGWNGLAGRADYCNENVPSDRGEKFAEWMEPMHDGNFALVMGQCRGDLAVAGVDLEAWVEQVAAELEESEYTKPVYFRPHPKDPDFPTSLPVLTDMLPIALQRADWVITYNSTSAVDAALAGCAVSAFDEGSMAWEIAGHGLEPRRSRRRPWLNKLAYCQWTETEMAEGKTWEHLATHLKQQ